MGSHSGGGLSSIVRGGGACGAGGGLGGAARTLLNPEPDAGDLDIPHEDREGVPARLGKHQVVEGEGPGDAGVAAGGPPGAAGYLDPLRQPLPPEQTVAVLVHQIDRQRELFGARPGHPDADAEAHRGMPGGKRPHPEQIPAPAQHIELAPHRLDRIGHHGELHPGSRIERALEGIHPPTLGDRR